MSPRYKLHKAQGGLLFSIQADESPSARENEEYSQ